MKNYLSILILLSFFLFSACVETPVERVVSPAESTTSVKAYFPKTGQSTYIVPLSAKNVKVLVKRDVSTGAVSIPIKESYDTSKCFTLPTVINFPAGQSEVTIEVPFTNLKPFVKYAFTLKMDDSFCTVYQELPGTQTFQAVVQQEDFYTAATGTYSDWWYEDTWDQIVEYSPLLKVYRLPDLWVAGTAFFFGIGKAPEGAPAGYFSITNYNGTKVEDDLYQTPTGINHKTYGAVSTQNYLGLKYAKNTFAKDMTTDGKMKVGSKIQFVRKFVVKAGSFGVGAEVLEITAVSYK